LLEIECSLRAYLSSFRKKIKERYYSPYKVKFLRRKVMPAGRSSRYTPPKSVGQKTLARQGNLQNMVMGLGAGNMGDSSYARSAQNAAFDKMERIRAFDAGFSPSATGKQGMAGATSLGGRSRIHAFWWFSQLW
jgi:hypothetical protein